MAYGTIESWRDYAAVRGNAAPTAVSNEDAQAALQRGSDYIRTRYVLRMGDGEWDTNEDVIEATYIAASLELAATKDGTVFLRPAPGFFARTYTPGERKVLTEVSGIRWTVLPGAERGDMTPVSTMIEALLAPWLQSGAVKWLARA